MEKTNKSIFSGTLVYTLCNVFVSGLAVITSPIFTRLMTVNDYGIYSLFNSWNSIVFCVSSLGLSYVIPPAIRKYKNNIDSFKICMTIEACILPVLLLISSIFGSTYLFAKLLSLPKITVVLLWVELIFYSVLMFENEKMTIKGEYKRYAILAILRALCSTILAILLILVESKNTYNGRIFSIIIVSIIICVYICWTDRKYIPDIVMFKEYTKFAVPIAIPMIFHGLAMIILGQIDRIMISNYYSEYETGLYSYGYSIGTMIMFVLNASSSAVQPFFYNKFHEDNHSIINIMKKYVGMMLVVCVIFALTAPEIIKLLADKKYWDTVSFVYPLIAGCFCQYIYTYYSKIEIIQNKTRYIAIGSALAAIINALLNVMLLPEMGYQIAAFTTFIGYFVLMLFHMIICRTMCKVNTFGYMRNIFSTIILFVIMSLFVLIIDKIIVRYILLIWAIAFLVIAYKSEIKIILKSKGKH